MADFYSFIDHIADKFEGGYQNLVKDNGNYTGGVVGKGTLVGTNHGIAAPTLSQWLGRTATVSDMKSLTKDEAKKIFKAFFWDKIKADKINNQGIAEFLFDWSLGSGYAYKEMNKALNSLYGTNFPTSGIQPFGDAQINVINSAKDQNKLLDTLKNYRLNWYQNIVKQDASQSGFLTSWNNRTMDIFNKWYGKFGQNVIATTQKIKTNPIPSIVITTLLLVSIFAIYKTIKRNK